MAAPRQQSRIYVPAGSATDWRPLLAHPDKQWQPGSSAHALATSWQDALGFPRAVRDVFAGSGPLFEEIEMVLGIPELKTPLPPRRSRASQTDLFVLARTRRVLVAISVEGKVEESFGPTVHEWLGSAPSPGKRERLDFLSQLLQIPPKRASNCRYQLMHRTAAAVLEAQRFNAQHAVLLVHSFSPDHVGFDDFDSYCDLLGTRAVLGDLAPASPRDGILLHLGWATDSA